jgi:hypothetical protein
LIIRYAQKIGSSLKAGYEALFQSSPGQRWLLVAWLVGLYAIGIAGFGEFLAWGNHTTEFADWAAITAPRLEFLKNAMVSGQLPLHIADPSPLHGWTQRFIAVSDTFYSPQMILLSLNQMTIQRFVLVNVWLMYTLGFAGLLALRRRLRLSAFSFTILFLLFNFNGHILAHLGVGHATWTGYFLFSWFVWLILRLLDGDRSWAWTLMLAGLLLMIWLQGSFHQFVWLLIMLALVGVCIPRVFWMAIRGGLFTLLACAFRILPATLMYGHFSFSYVGGYADLFTLWQSLAAIENPQDTHFYPLDHITGITPAAWEITVYIGLTGALFLLFFGIYRGMAARTAPYLKLAFPLGIMTLFSLGSVFTLVLKLPVPLIQGENVAARMFSVVLVFLLVIAAERFQRWLENSSGQPLVMAASLLGLAYTISDLWENFQVWRMANLVHFFGWAHDNPNLALVNNQSGDTELIGMMVGGLALSLVTLLGLAWLVWREHRKQNPSQAAP